MHKYCGDEQLLACHYPQGRCNCCCAATTMLPRNCSSCIWPRQINHGGCMCHKRNIIDNYMKICKQLVDMPCWRRTKRAHKEPVSLENLRAQEPLQVATAVSQAETKPKQKCKKKSAPIKRPTEIIIQPPKECKRGYLRMMSKLPNFDCPRMRAVLLQRALFNECNCDPYDILPEVPLTFYPKWPEEDSMPNFLRCISSDCQCCLKSKKRLTKEFLTSLNKLYANVGGGMDAGYGFANYFYGPFDREHEFEGFFGPATKSTYKLPLEGFITNTRRHSQLAQPCGWKTLTDRSSLLNSTPDITRFKAVKGSRVIVPSGQSPSKSSQRTSPTKIRNGDKQHFKTSPSQIHKYMGGRTACKKFKRID
uniref:Uncharacterized protein n=1 Tax=Zeugodacus cucurbitae TaxID=28588 RepID=A0A0A1XNG4_ZEUCU